MNYDRERGCFSENYVEKSKRSKGYFFNVIMELSICKVVLKGEKHKTVQEFYITH